MVRGFPVRYYGVHRSGRWYEFVMWWRLHVWPLLLWRRNYMQKSVKQIAELEAGYAEIYTKATGHWPRIPVFMVSPSGNEGPYTAEKLKEIATSLRQAEKEDSNHGNIFDRFNNTGG